MSAKKKTVCVVYYSMYGHIEKLAREVAKGLEKSGGILKIQNSFTQNIIFI